MLNQSPRANQLPQHLTQNNLIRPQHNLLQDRHQQAQQMTSQDSKELAQCPLDYEIPMPRYSAKEYLKIVLTHPFLGV